MEQIKVMFEAMKNDSAFTAKIQDLIKNSDTAGIIRLAKEKGFVITETDWQAYLEWSQGVLAGKQSKVIPPDELDNISGGSNEPEGHYDNPRKGGCWFKGPGGSEFRNGYYRKKCKAFACIAQVLSSPGGWHRCCCWGTNRCIDAWHLEIKCNN